MNQRLYPNYTRTEVKMTIADGFMLGFTFTIAISTGALWWQTKRSHELTLFLQFLEFIKEAKGLGREPGEKIRQHVMDQIYHPKPIFEVLDKAFPGYSKKFKKIFKLDKEALKIVDPGFYPKNGINKK